MNKARELLNLLEMTRMNHEAVADKIATRFYGKRKINYKQLELALDDEVRPGSWDDEDWQEVVDVLSDKHRISVDGKRR